MATIIPFPNAAPAPLCGLSRQECTILEAEATGLIHDGLATDVSIHNDGQYMCVYDCQGAPYYLGREEGVVYLFDHQETLRAESTRFAAVLQKLGAVLASPVLISENRQSRPGNA